MEQYVLFPCSGKERLNIPRGHLCEVKDKFSGKFLGFITEEVAKEKYGEENYIISSSDSLCPICLSDNKHKLKLISLES